MKLKALDFLAILLSLLVIGAFSISAYPGKDASQDVVIESPGAPWIYPLGVDRQVRVAGPLGDTVVTIKGGRAFVDDSPCPDKLCVHMPAIARPGQWIACLPNRMFYGSQEFGSPRDHGNTLAGKRVRVVQFVGVMKATAMTGLIVLSQFSIRPNLRMPGRFGGLVGRSLYYFEAIMNQRGSVDRRDVIGSVDALLLSLGAAPQALAAGTSSPAGSAREGVAGHVLLVLPVAANWGLFAFTLVHPHPFWGG